MDSLSDTIEVRRRCPCANREAGSPCPQCRGHGYITEDVSMYDLAKELRTILSFEEEED